MSKTKKIIMMTCYCGNTETFENCCAQAHQNINQADTAEKLMRSRYAAYATANGDYLMRSHHSSTCPTKDKKDIVRWAKSVQWVKLDIISTHKGAINDTEGTVEFKAFYYTNEGLQMIHENSKFVKEKGHWVYFGEA